MQVKFYTDSDKPIWNSMKHNICQNILDNICGDHNLRYYIHFDKMIYNIGWFFGFVEIWKGKDRRERHVKRMPFAAHVTDWGSREECKRRSSYRVKVKG